MGDPIVIRLLGKIPSKKNSYTPNKNGKGFHKSKDLQSSIDRLAMQVPGHVRDLRLKSPRIDFHFEYERANWDRDNATTCLLDILVSMGTLVDDNICQCNGIITIHPAQRSDTDAATIVLTPAE